jgi:hypothetical protein
MGNLEYGTKTSFYYWSYQYLIPMGSLIATVWATPLGVKYR